MSRPIKFRAWSKVTNEMLMQGISPYTNASDIVGQCEDPTGSYKLMQYTGLTDKNGVEIYEGDIVKVPEHCEGDLGMCEDTQEVDYDEAEFYLTSKLHPYTNLWDVIVNCDAEVIGNIYENPELLEQPHE